ATGRGQGRGRNRAARARDRPSCGDPDRREQASCPRALQGGRGGRSHSASLLPRGGRSTGGDDARGGSKIRSTRGECVDGDQRSKSHTADNRFGTGAAAYG